MQQAQCQWFEQQRELSYAREERILTQVVAETARSTGFLINQILTSLSHYLPQPTQQPQPMYSQPHDMYQKFRYSPDRHHSPAQTSRSSTPSSERHAEDYSEPRFYQHLSWDSCALRGLCPSLLFRPTLLFRGCHLFSHFSDRCTLFLKKRKSIFIFFSNTLFK